MDSSPPKLARRLLLSFLRDDLIEEVLGDLDEKFYSTTKKKSLLRAKINYWYQVLNYLRPFAIRKGRASHANHYDMFQNYFKIGYRHLLRNKGYSFINIGGLSLGIAVAMLIGLWIHSEWTFNSYHPREDRVAQVLQHQTLNGEKKTQVAIPFPLGLELQKSYGEDFKYVVMSSWTATHILSAGEHVISGTGNYMDMDAPRLLALNIQKGSLDGLRDPGSIMLSASVSQALFGDRDPINQALQIDNKLDVKVTAVYEDLPMNCGFNELKFIAPWELYVGSETWVQYSQHQWGNNSYQLFVEIADHASMEGVSDRIKDVKAHASKSEGALNPEISLWSMVDWHLRSNFENGVQTGGRIQFVWLFGIIGIFVLLLACINFMNLSTARSEQRAREVGIRKSIGSVRRQLINQFLSESFLVVVVAFIFALAMVAITLTWFNVLSGKQMVLPIDEPVFWLLGVAFILVTGLLAGSYPALYLSSFQPVKVLKGTFRAGRFASLPRRILVVVQFTVSVTLIIGTIVVYNQIQFAKNRPLGYDRNGIIMIEMSAPDFYGKYDVLRDELKNVGAIEEMTESSSPLTQVWTNNSGFEWEGRDPALQTDFAMIWTTPEYGRTLGWQVVEGRDFSRQHATDSTAFIINEAAVAFMGIQDPVGKTVRWNGKDYSIIGVVKDVIMDSPYAPVKQTVYLIDFENVNWILLKLNPDLGLSESIAKAEGVFKKLVPNVPFDFHFADQEHARKFEMEERIAKLSTIFTVLAVIISCLGLFGLASFVAEQRTKEIGIRKVLGASVVGLWQMLSRDFVMLVIIACVIAVPVAWYVFSNWLESYEYHTEISVMTFLISIFGAVLITLLTVSYQAIRAALMNPVRSLKAE